MTGRQAAADKGKSIWHGRPSTEEEEKPAQQFERIVITRERRKLHLFSPNAQRSQAVPRPKVKLNGGRVASPFLESGRRSKSSPAVGRNVVLLLLLEEGRLAGHGLPRSLGRAPGAPLLHLGKNVLHGPERVGRGGLEDSVPIVIGIAGERHFAKKAVAIAARAPGLEQVIRCPEFSKPFFHSAELGRAIGSSRGLRVAGLRFVRVACRRARARRKLDGRTARWILRRRGGR